MVIYGFWRIIDCWLAVIFWCFTFLLAISYWFLFFLIIISDHLILVARWKTHFFRMITRCYWWCFIRINFGRFVWCQFRYIKIRIMFLFLDYLFIRSRIRDTRRLSLFLLFWCLFSYNIKHKNLLLQLASLLFFNTFFTIAQLHYLFI